MVFGTNYPNTSTGTYLSPFTTDQNGNTTIATGTNRQSGATFANTDPNDPQRQFGYIRAQAGNGLVKVISSPQLLVSSHTEASINVGQSVPYVSNSLSNASSSGNVSNSYTYKDVGVILKVTPYVTSTDLISLEITQTMSSAVPNTITHSDQPVFSQRTLETSMTIANGQTMVLGGLIQENTKDNLDSVPIINQIPLLKRLLGSTSASVERTEVLVLITGYIVNEHSEIETLISRYNDAVKALNHYDKTLGDKPDAQKHRGVLFSNEEFWK
jgi:type II secretory pathway component GspD/PulD (secretin)